MKTSPCDIADIFNTTEYSSQHHYRVQLTLPLSPGQAQVDSPTTGRPYFSSPQTFHTLHKTSSYSSCSTSRTNSLCVHPAREKLRILLVRDWLLITGRGEAKKQEGGHVKFYPYEKGGGGKSFSLAKGGAQKVLG